MEVKMLVGKRKEGENDRCGSRSHGRRENL
jgi:hypothetical protein